MEHSILSDFCMTAVCGLAHATEPFAEKCGHPLPFRLSLAEWSLEKSLHEGRITNLDFPRIAKQEFGIDCIELVDQFFEDKVRDMAYLQELKARADAEGVTIGLLMVDTNGPLGAADETTRREAIEMAYAWIDAAKFLGCHAMRVNAYGDGPPEALASRIIDSCRQLADYAAPLDLNIVIENHGEESSNADWLVPIIQAVGRPNFGSLPDFGNFPPEIDRYDAIEKLMPYAKAVSAKAMQFTPEGLVKETDFFRMMRIVREGGFSGYVGIETEPDTADEEADAIRKTRDLLLRIRDEQG